MFFITLLALLGAVSGYERNGYLVKEASKDGLVHWTDNYNLDVARSMTVTPGEPLDVVFTCLHENCFTECRIYLREAGYLVTKDAVMDNEGNNAEGFTPWSGNDDMMVCGMTIASFDPAIHADDLLSIYAEFIIPPEVGMGKAYGAVSIEDEVSLGLRLPDNAFAPEQYVYIDPDYSSDFTADGSAYIKFSGATKINVSVTEDTQCIPFHTDEMYITDVQVMGYNGFLDIGFDFQRTFTYVCLGADGFKKDNDYIVSFIFEVDTIRGGYYPYGLYYQPCTPGSSKNCWYTQGESTNIRNIFPCFDEPGFKTVISFETFTVPEGYSILSNNPVVQNEDIFTAEGTVSMSAYLFALAITDYVKKPSSVREDTAVWCSQEDFDAGRADYSAEKGARVIDYYEEYFGVKYALPKLDLVSEIQKFGAMENWGLVLFDPRTLLLDPELADVEISNTRWTVSSVVAHELAHQWFGNLVTCDWWDQTWLNEGFATYVSFLGTADIDPTNLPWPRMVVEETKYAMSYDADTTIHWAMTDPVTTRYDVDRKFGVYTYSKGGSVIRMIEGVLTEPVMRAGLSTYLNEFAFESATEDGLFFYLGEAGERDGTWPGQYSGAKSFSEVMKGWTNQAGYPVITATVDCSTPFEKCTAEFSQAMYTTNGSPDQDRTWTVPIFTSMAGSSDTAIVWLESSGKQETVVDLKSLYGDVAESSVFIANQDSYGYYRVLYNDDHWARIADVIREDKEQISVLTRISIICDALDFNMNGMLSEDVFNNLISAWNDDWTQEETWAYNECSSGFKRTHQEKSYKYRI